MKNIIYILALIIICSSCTKPKEELLSVGNEIELNTTSYPNEIVMGNPLGIMIFDNVLYLYQTIGDRAALVMDKEDGSLIESWGHKGNGPGEFMTPKPWGERGDKIYLHDQNRFTVREYRKEKKNNHTNLILTKELLFERTKMSLSFATVLENGNFVASNLFGTKEPLLLLNSQLDSLKNFGGISDYEASEDITRFYGTLSSYKNKFVFATNNLGYIACYEQVNNNNIELKWKHYLEKPLYKDKYLDVKSLKRGFVDVKMTKNYIFCVYSGIKHSMNDDDQPENILMFDHQGKLLNNFHVNRDISRIAVSEDEKTIYITSLEPDISIIKADISKYR